MDSVDDQLIQDFKEVMRARHAIEQHEMAVQKAKANQGAR